MPVAKHQEQFTHTHHVGRTQYGRLFVTIKHKDGKLSITGVVGPMRNGDCRGSCGQVRSELLELTSYATGWDARLAKRLYDVWQRWHLNDMVAGSPAQEQFLRNKRKQVVAEHPEYENAPHSIPSKLGFDSHYNMVCSWLSDADLLVDNGYRYGTKWLHEYLPAQLVDWLYGLPAGDDTIPPCWAS